MSDVELLELVLAYAIPRRDVAPLAEVLLSRFGSLRHVLRASREELESVGGIGESSAVLLQLIACIVERDSETVTERTQETLWPEPLPLVHHDALEPRERELRTFGNDEVENALQHLPEAARFETYDDYKQYLQDSLPYNSDSTRVRRASYLMNRFFPDGTLATPLAFFTSRCNSLEDLKAAVFYEMLRAEPIAAKIAEEVIWPALPKGSVHREVLRETVLKYLPDLKSRSQQKTLKSLLNTFSLLGVATEQDDALHFRIHRGTKEGFLYVLLAEFPQPGMPSFQDLDSGPMRRWLLWDREWMHRQLYDLRDSGIVSKVSEIDDIRQFTLAFDQMTGLRHYFEAG